MNTEELLDLLGPRLSADRICRLAQAIQEHDQWNSFDRYRLTADLLVREFHEARADSVERHPIPCDGRTLVGDWVMPLAWDAQDGTLDLIDSDGRCALRLADYRAVPNNLIRWSAPVDGPREFPLLALPEAAQEENWRGVEAAGKFVYTHSPGRAARRWAVKYGAAGLVTDFSTAPREFPNSVHWENAWTDLALWGPTQKDSPLAGFSISPAMGEELQARLAVRRPPRMVRANVRARLYEGTTDVISAAIQGADRPEEEIICYAHIYECQIDDNAASAATCVEMVRVARDLIVAGLLPRPKRTIRFVLGWEWIGSMWWALNQRQGRQWLASLCNDGICQTQSQTRLPLDVSLSPTMAASFADALFVQTWKAAFRPLPMKAWRTAPWTAGTDTYWVDPQLGDVSNVYPHQEAGPTWHKSHTTVGDLDREVVSAATAACLAWMLDLAGADASRARHFSRLGAERLRRRVRRHAEAFNFARRDVDAARVQYMAELASMEASAQRVIDTTRLAPGDGSVAAAVTGLRQRVAAEAGECRRDAEAAFAATRSEVPDWEARRGDDMLIERDERVADNLIPTRLVPGYLWSLHRFSNERRWACQKLGRVDALCLFLCDGRRTLLEIARLARFEDDTIDIRDLVRQFRMLAAGGYVRLDARRTFSAEDLLKGLRDLGVNEGDTILAHTSLFGLGPMDKDAETAFEALALAVGPAGTVAMPAFAYAKTSRPPYDPAQSRSQAGELSDLFWRRPGALRSRHPSHGLAAQGRRAQWILSDNERYEPYDIRGAFGRLDQLDAKVLFIGSGLQCNSTLHAVEDWAALPSLAPATYHYINAAGEREQVEYKRIPQHARDFYKTRVSAYETLVRQKGLLREGVVGLAKSFLLRSRDIVDFGLELLQKRQFEFLIGRQTRDPDVMAIESRVAEWKFPEGVWEQIKALRHTPPG
jgi:aminoglycoside 3-N-acetyltransferase